MTTYWYLKTELQNDRRCIRCWVLFQYLEHNGMWTNRWASTPSPLLPLPSFLIARE